MKLALIALLAVSTLAYAAPTPEHGTVTKQIAANYHAAVKVCNDARLPKERFNACIHDAQLTRKDAIAQEKVIEHGRKTLAAKDAAMRKQAAKDAAAVVLPVPSDKPKP